MSRGTARAREAAPEHTRRWFHRVIQPVAAPMPERPVGPGPSGRQAGRRMGDLVAAASASLAPALDAAVALSDRMGVQDLEGAPAGRTPRACPSSRQTAPRAAGAGTDRHRIENAFEQLKHWRRFATRYDRCAQIFLSAIRIIAAVTFWLT